MQVFIRAAVALVVGFLAGWVVGAATPLRIVDLLGLYDRDGAYAIASFFIFGPFAGAVTAATAAIVVIVRELRKGTTPPVGTDPPRPADRRRWTMLVAALALAWVYLAGWALIDFTGPWAPKSFVRSLFYNGIPLVLGLAGAGAVIWVRGRATKTA